MSHPNFQRKAIAAAISSIIAAGTVGTAMAQIEFGDDARPQLDGTVFLGAGANGSNVRLTSTAAADDLVSATIYYFDANGVATTPAAGFPSIDTDGAAMTIDLSVAPPAGATQGVIILDTSGSADDAFGSDYAYVNSSGQTVRSGAAGDTVPEMIAAALANDGLHPIVPGYTGITVADAKRDLASLNTIVYVTFDADPTSLPAGAAGANIPATDFVAITAGVGTVTKTLDDGTAAPGLSLNQAAFKQGDQAVGDAPPLTPFPGDVTRVEISGTMLDDGAGNIPTTLGTVQPVAVLGPPAYRTSGMVATAVGWTGVSQVGADELYGDGFQPTFGGSGSALAVLIGMDVEPDTSTWQEEDVAFSPAADIDVVGTSSIPDSNGMDTILGAGIIPTGDNKFFFSGTGALLVGEDRDTAGPVTVNITLPAGGGPDSPLALKLNPLVEIAADLGETPVMAGQTQATFVATRDANMDGWVDGGSIDFRQDLDALPTNVGLISYTEIPATGMLADRVVLATDPAAFAAGSSSVVNVDLTAPDIPLPDGTAPPGNANNDYNGDTFEDDVDQGFVIAENLNTGIDKTFTSPGVPWEGMLGTNDLASPIVDGTYTNAWNPLSGAQLTLADLINGTTLGGSLLTNNLSISVDGAAPVVQSVTYTETVDAAAAAAAGVDRSGDVTIGVSELVQAIGSIADATNDSINEFLFGGVPSDLLNLAATIADQVAITIDALIGAGGDSDEIMLTNLPRAALIDDTGTAANAVLSLGTTGGAEDVNGAPLFIADNVVGVVASTVVEGAPAGPVLTGGSFVFDGTAEEWYVCAMYDQELEDPAGQTDDDRNGLNTVRALIGFTEGGQSSSSGPLGPENDPLNPGDEDTAIFQFLIPGANVTTGSPLCDGGALDQVLLAVPGGLPADTVKIWIDTDPASQDEIDAGSLRYVANADGVPNQDDDGHQFDDDFGQVADDDGNFVMGDSRDVPVRYTLSGDPDGEEDGDNDVRDGADMFWPTVNDVDTVMVDGNSAPFFNNNDLVGDDSRVLFTKTVRGTAVHAGVPYPPDTAIRADLIRVMPMAPSFGQPGKKAKVRDGWIDIRQGSNSEYNEVCNCQLDSWLTVALLNDDAVAGSDFDTFNQLYAGLSAAEGAFYTAQANNESFATLQELSTAVDKAQNKLNKKYPGYYIHTMGGGSAYIDHGIPLFVEVTNGAGTAAPKGTSVALSTSSQSNTGVGDDNDDNVTFATTKEQSLNTAQANGNASYGRTATLLDSIPNVQANGTSYYPVVLDMFEGELFIPESSWATNNLGHGFLDVVNTVPELPSVQGTPVYEVLDTAYALTMGDTGMYQITVGVDEQALTSDSNELVPQNSTICTMISILPSNVRGEYNWVHTTSCDPSFTAFIPFVADIETDGSGMIHNIDTDNVAMAYVFDDADWNLLAIAGTPDRDDSVPLDPSWFWVQPWPETGRPSTFWGLEGGFSDAMFTMQDSKMDLAFEIGSAADNMTVGEVNPFPGAALGYKGDGRIWDEQDSASGGFSYCGGQSMVPDNDCTKGKIVDDDSSPEYRKMWVPVTGLPQDTTLEEGWSLVTVGEGSSVDNLVGTYPQIDAVIIFNTPAAKDADPDEVDNMSGRDDDGDMRFDEDVDTIVWFSGDTPTVSTFNGPVAAFIHVNGTLTGYNVDGAPVTTP